MKKMIWFLGVVGLVAVGSLTVYAGSDCDSGKESSPACASEKKAACDAGAKKDCATDESKAACSDKDKSCGSEKKSCG